MRERMAQPRLTGGICADQAWAKAPCTDLELAYLFDLELDNNGHMPLAEKRSQREARHAEAINLCRDCPALQLCAAEPIDGRQGVIAGRVVT